MRFIRATDKYCTLGEHVSAPIFRRSFELDGQVESTELEIAVSGFYELYINGENITKGLLAPYINNPDHIVYVDTYDVSRYLVEGKNALAVILGNGFANQDIEGWNFNKASFRAPLCLALKLRVKTDSTQTEICSDESFKVSDSHILFDMYRLGVIYDLRESKDGFSLPEYDDSKWEKARYTDAPSGTLTHSRALSIRVREELSAVRIERQRDFYALYYKDGTPVKECYIADGWLYDFGVNAAGVCRLRIRGDRGQMITVRHAEALKDGYFNIGSTITVREGIERHVGYLQTDVYYLKGGEEEIIFPSFTYHGFRYAFVEGIKEEQATPDLLTYAVFNTDVNKRSHFECSNEILNKLYEMSIRADLSNFHHFPTDCPHREKNGWTGDASVSAHQLTLSFDCADAFLVWLENIRCAQLPSGKLPGIVPTSGWGYEWGSGPAWDAAIVNLPYYVYKYDGRTDIISENAEMIDRYLSYIASMRDKRGLVACGLGDWCQPRPEGAPISSPLEFTDSVQVIEMAHKSEIMFKAIERADLAQKAQRLEADMRRAVREHLIDKESAMAAGCCQTSQALAIRFGLFDSESEGRAYDNLIAMIEEKDGHVDCGMIGLRHIFHVLFEGGDTELAIRMISREDAPSYGNMIKLGGTSLFEALEQNGLNESQNHHFFGDIIELFITKLVGIRVNPDLCDPKSVLIAPSLPGSIDFASSYYDFPQGRLSVSLVRGEDGRVHATLGVPKGVRASYRLGKTKKKLAPGEHKLTIDF